MRGSGRQGVATRFPGCNGSGVRCGGEFLRFGAVVWVWAVGGDCGGVSTGAAAELGGGVYEVRDFASAAGRLEAETEAGGEDGDAAVSGAAEGGAEADQRSVCGGAVQRTYARGQPRAESARARDGLCGHAADARGASVGAGAARSAGGARAGGGERQGASRGDLWGAAGDGGGFHAAAGGDADGAVYVESVEYWVCGADEGECRSAAGGESAVWGEGRSGGDPGEDRYAAEVRRVAGERAGEA